MRKHLARFRRQTRGAAAIELGIIFPFFAILVLGIIEYGMVMFQLMNVNHAAQVGAQFAQLNGFDVASIQNAVNAATGIGTASVTATQVCGCANGTAISPTTACPPPQNTCAGGLTAGAYVTVTIRQDYSPVAPGIASPLTAVTVVRVQ